MIEFVVLEALPVNECGVSVVVILERWSNNFKDPCFEFLETPFFQIKCVPLTLDIVANHLPLSTFPPL